MKLDTINPIVRVVLIGGLLVVLMLVLGLGVPTIYKNIKQNRIEDLLKEARAEEEAGRWQSAINLAESAHLLRENDIRPLLQLVRLTTLHSPAEAPDFLEKLIMHRDVQESDLAAIADLLVENGRLEAAELVFAGSSGFNEDFQKRADMFRQEIAKEMSASPPAESDTDPVDLGEQALQALRENPDDPALQLSTGTQLLASRAIFHVQEGQKILLDLARDTTKPQSLEALQIMIMNRQALDISAYDEVFKLLVRHPDKTLKDKLWVYYELSYRQPERQPLFLQKVLELAEKEAGIAGQPSSPEEIQPSPQKAASELEEDRPRLVALLRNLPAEKLELFATWLQMTKENEWLLDVLQKDVVMAAQRESLYVLRARALRENDDPRLAYETLDLGKEVLPPVERNRWQAILAIQFDNPSLAREHWQAALLHALNDQDARYLNETLDMAGIGREIQLVEPQMQAQLGRPEDVPAESRPLIVALNQAFADRNQRSVAMLVDELYERFPQLPASRRAKAWLDLLADLPPRRALELMSPLVDQFPQDFSYRTVLALAQVRDKNPTGALRTLEGTPGGVRWSTSGSSEALAGFVVYLANEKEDLARKILPLIQEDELLPAELRLLEEQRAKMLGRDQEYLAMAETLLREKQYKALLRLMRKRVEDSPEQADLQRELLYLQLLDPAEYPPVIASLEELAAENPEDPHFRAVLALARLKAGDPAGAREEIEQIDWDWTSQPPRYLMIYTAVMAASSNELLHEEARLMRRWLSPAPAAGAGAGAVGGS